MSTEDHSWYKGELPTWQEVEAKIKELNESGAEEDPDWQEKLKAKMSEHNSKIVDLGRRIRESK